MEQPTQDIEPNVSPEEQKSYEAFVDQGLRVIYEKETINKIAETVKASEDPIDGLAQATANIVTRLVTSAKDQKVEIDGSIALHGGIEIMEAIADTLTEMDIYEFTAADLERASYMAMDYYREINKGSTEIEDAAINDFETLKGADKSGELGDRMGELGMPEHLTKQGLSMERQDPAAAPAPAPAAAPQGGFEQGMK